MYRSYRSTQVFSTLLLLGTLSLAIVGCNKGGESSDSSSSGAAGAPKQTASASGGSGGGDGASIFGAKCAGCHKLGSTGGGRAPDLTHIGGEKDAASLAEFIKNPKSKNPGSRMPGFEGKISDTDMKTLTEYLASQK